MYRRKNNAILTHGDSSKKHLRKCHTYELITISTSTDNQLIMKVNMKCSAVLNAANLK